MSMKANTLKLPTPDVNKFPFSSEKTTAITIGIIIFFSSFFKLEVF